jgi:hypothetical protein
MLRLLQPTMANAAPPVAIVIAPMSAGSVSAMESAMVPNSGPITDDPMLRPMRIVAHSAALSGTMNEQADGR